MAKINTRVTVNTPQAAAKIKAACNTALTDMGLQALQDVSKHVPHDQGTLEDSGLTNSYKSHDWRYPFGSNTARDGIV